MWVTCVLIFALADATVLDYYFPNSNDEFPDLGPFCSAQINGNNEIEFTFTNDSSLSTDFVYDDDMIFNFFIEFDTHANTTAQFMLDFGTNSDVTFDFRIALTQFYVTLLQTDVLCSGTGKTIPFHIDFRQKVLSCGTSQQKPIIGFLKGTDFDIDIRTLRVPLMITWNVVGANLFWKVPKKTIPFKNSQRPTTRGPTTTKKATTVVTTVASTLAPETTNAPKKTAKAGFPVYGYILIIAAVFIAVAATVAVVITIRKRKSMKKPSPDDQYPVLPADPPPFDGTGTRRSESNEKQKSSVLPPSSQAVPPPSALLQQPSSKPINTVAQPGQEVPPPSKPPPKADIEKTTDLTFDGRDGFVAQSPGQPIDKPTEHVNPKRKSQRTDEIFT